MTKILFWLGVIAAAYLAWTMSRRMRRVTREEGGRKAKRDPNAPVAMIECPWCGTHFPEDEAVLGDGKSYCSERCRNAAREKVRR